jgi:hypothetical protein
MSDIARIKALVFANHQFTQDEQYLEKPEKPGEPRVLSHVTELESQRVLSLLGNEKKAIAFVDPIFFPFLFQSLTEIVLFYSRIKNRDTKLYIYVLRDFFGKDGEEHWKKIKDFFVSYLEDTGIEFEFLDTNSFDVVKINNFLIMPKGFSAMGIKMLGSRIRRYFQKTNTKPFRKVFVARKDYLSQRVDDENKIRDFFVSAGFEVVYPENFKTFLEQVNYFSECRVIAGVSGSALSNCIFMKPEGAVIELSSFFTPGLPNDPVEIHDFYRVMAKTMNHLYFSVSLFSKKTIDFQSNKKALDIIKML